MITSWIKKTSKKKLNGSFCNLITAQSYWIGSKPKLIYRNYRQWTTLSCNNNKIWNKYQRIVNERKTEVEPWSTIHWPSVNSATRSSLSFSLIHYSLVFISNSFVIISLCSSVPVVCLYQFWFWLDQLALSSDQFAKRPIEKKNWSLFSSRCDICFFPATYPVQLYSIFPLIWWKNRFKQIK